MSLVDQSQQWFPTSVQVTVHQARNLRPKGKNGTNDAYAIIQMAKDKFSTSVAEKSMGPTWKEEASFDLPLFHPGNAERCTLYIIVMHRAQVGLDKFLGQAVVNLVELHENKTRQKPDWFPLVDKSGKADKLRGDVLLGISFMRNNMSASMVDLSMQDKHRSRLSKLKDKVRLKKKGSFSDTTSAIVPPVSQVLTDSEGEPDAASLQSSQIPGEKKKSKLKKLFAPKSTLQRNTSQSLSTLGTPPEKNLSRSSSRSSGLNVETPEVKKKFKFLGHKRSGSSDSKVSLGPLSLLGRSKHSNSDLNNVSVNGNHVYEEGDAISGSTLSLNSSGQGSVENVHQQTMGVFADKSAQVLSFRSESQNRLMMEKQSHQEEEERRQVEARSMAEAMTLQDDEERRKAEALRLQEDYERSRRFLEDEARREKEEEERRKLEAAENEEHRRLEEQTKRAEEQKRQEEASMGERLSSLFGIIRKKEEKKEDVQQYPKEELTTQTPNGDDVSFMTTNPFEDISLSSGPQFNNSEHLSDDQKPRLNPQTPSAMLFLNRTAKVSTVKPRLTHSLDSEYSDPQTPSSPVAQQWSSPAVLTHFVDSEYSEPKPESSPVHQHRSSPSVLTHSLDSKYSAPQTPSSPVAQQWSSPAVLTHSLDSEYSEPKPHSSPVDQRRSSPSVLTDSLDSKYSAPQTSSSPVAQQWSSPAVLTHSLDSKYPAPQPPGSPVDQQWSSPAASEFTLSSVPSDTPDTFSNLHSSLAPVRLSEKPPGSPSDSIEKVSSVPSSPTMTDQTKRSPLPPLYPIYETQTGRIQSPAREVKNPRHTEGSAEQKLSLPLPDYETLFPQKRHGVQGHTRWDHIIAEVNQRHMDYTPELMGPEMSVDGPENPEEVRSSIPEERLSLGHFQTHYKETKRVSSKKVAAPPPPKPVLTLHSRSVSEEDVQRTDESLIRRLPQVPAGILSDDISKRESLPELPRTGSKKALQPPLHRPTTGTPAEQTKGPVTTEKDVPTARPRRRVSMKEPTEQHFSSAMPDLADMHTSSINQKLPSFSMSEMDKNSRPGKETISEYDPYPSTDPLSKDTWVPEKPPRDVDGLYGRISKKEQKPENRGMTADDLDHIFSEEKSAGLFTNVNGYQTSEYNDYGKGEDDSRPISPVFQRRNSQKQPILSRSNSQKALKFQQNPAAEEQTTIREQELPTRDVVIESITQRHPADEPLPVVMEEPSSETQVFSVRKTRALLPPAEADFISAQSSNGGDLATTLHRPHPVKPMHTTESSLPISTFGLRDLHVHNGTAGKVKMAGLADSGPFTQLTHEELITLVVRQQADLSKKESKISELEDYIDNLLVRVIEEKPAILQAMNTTKPV
ncbi:rab11 family-interacting protein 1 isoform X2 [Dunckerocampus dactyliophorus]|uniref:rab11 family-interacting protein 1 isoform X2 n=1 Tax=Dunckerocampus dactyliophorus TaxID=161453 RepID=UPI002405265A|nr:rab11 family-interacting protein 1 isoform X2 [Dunckerocampus dactyliophorus]